MAPHTAPTAPDGRSPRTRRGRTGAIATLAATAGIAIGALAFGPTPASGELEPWTTPTLEAPFGAGSGAGFHDVGYTVDDDDIVRLRGGSGANPDDSGPVEVARVAGGGGPWVARVFKLPCDLAPAAVVAEPIIAFDLNGPGIEGYDGMVVIMPDGWVSAGAFDIQVQPDEEGDLMASYGFGLDGVTFEADPSPTNPEVCTDPPGTTTTTEAETTTTTEAEG